MVPVFLPDRPSFAKLVAQVAQEEIQVLLRLRERVLERFVNIVDLWLATRVLDLGFEKSKICAIVCDVSLRIKLPPRFDVSRDELDWLQCFDQIERLTPGGEDGWSLDFLDPSFLALLLCNRYDD